MDVHDFARYAIGPRRFARSELEMKLAHIALWTEDLDGLAEFWRRYFEADISEQFTHARNGILKGRVFA